MLSLLATLSLLLPALAGAADGGQVPLTPFETKKTSPEGDELVCEKDVVHPTTKPGAMGVRHCWKKSDPKTVIERPFNFMTAEDLRGAVQGGAQGFPPLKKPRIPPAKKKAPVKKTPAQ